MCVGTLKSTAVGVISRVAAVASNLRNLIETLSPAAVLAATDPKLLMMCESTAVVADTTSYC